MFAHLVGRKGIPAGKDLPKRAFSRTLPTPEIAFVAQLDRASASEAEGCGFDPRRMQLLSWHTRI